MPNNTLNCNDIPENWDDFNSQIIKQIQVFIGSAIKCAYINFENYQFNNEIIIKQEVIDRITSLLDDLNELRPTLVDSFTTLTTYLASAPLNCYDNTWYNNYMTNYNEFRDIIFEINLLIKTNGEFIGYDFNTEASTSVIYPSSGATSTKTTYCNGVYMKQMNLGSDFIGSVNIMETPNKETFSDVEMIKQQLSADGSIKVR